MTTETTVSLDLITDADPPVKLPFGDTFVMPAFRDTLLVEGRALRREVRVPLWADDAFHKLWKKHQLAFYERGYSIRSEDKKWTLVQLIRPHIDEPGVYTQTVLGQERVNIARSGELALEPVKIELGALPSEIEAKLLDYQIEPARQLLRALVNGPKEWGYPGAIDASQMGVGKTFQSLAAAIAYARAHGLEIFVVCPLAVIGASPSFGGRGSGWKGAFAHFNHVARGVYNYESLRTGNRDFVKKQFYRGDENRTMMRYEWTLDPKKTILLWDECHKLRVVGSQNQALAMAALRQGFPCIFMSGTIASDPTHMRATGRAVGLHRDGTWVPFLRANGCYGRNEKGKGWKFCGGSKGQRILQHLHHTVFPLRGARVRIQDLGDKFPSTQIICEAYQTDATAKINQAFRDAEHAIERLRDQGDLNDEQAMRKRMNYYMDAWHQSERAKVEGGLLEELIEEEMEEGRSVAVFMGFTDTREELMRRLKTDCGIFGGQNPKDRNSHIEAFQQDRARVIVCNIAAGGVGVSLHDVNGNHPRTALILPHNSAEVVNQAFGRVHRAGGMSKSRQLVVFSAGGVEERICDAVRRKMSQTAALQDGDLSPPRVF